jgi:isopentenyl phosphate kinase
MSDLSRRATAQNEEQNQMSKKDYEFIASVIRNLDVTGGMRDRIARAFASELLNTNPRFDLQRFVNACGHAGAKVKLS